MLSKSKFTDEDIDLPPYERAELDEEIDDEIERQKKRIKNNLQGLIKYDNEGKIIDKPISPGIKSPTEDNPGPSLSKESK